MYPWIPENPNLADVSPCTFRVLLQGLHTNHEIDGVHVLASGAPSSADIPRLLLERQKE